MGPHHTYPWLLKILSIVPVLLDVQINWSDFLRSSLWVSHWKIPLFPSASPLYFFNGENLGCPFQYSLNCYSSFSFPNDLIFTRVCESSSGSHLPHNHWQLESLFLFYTLKKIHFRNSFMGPVQWRGGDRVQGLFFTQEWKSKGFPGG